MSAHLDSSDSELFDTQTPNALSELRSQEINKDPVPVWGRLYPVIVYLPAVDLSKQCIILGRAADCDVIFSKDNFPRPPYDLRNVSKNHLIISRSEQGQFAYVSDLSKNGTSVNGIKVGNGQRKILENDDEIAIGATGQRIYIYKTIESGKSPYLPPELKNKYEISKVLGTGAYGEVRLAFEKNTFTKYAIKRILKSNISCQDTSKRSAKIQTEAKILETLSHPCIISTKEMAETDEAVFIVLEFMEGGELTKLIPRDVLSENLAKLIFYQIVLGVHYLHQQGVIHRDLKPANILLKTDEIETLVKISDFGLSKVLHSKTLLKTTCGTPSFVAPEVWDSTCKEYDQQSDVWSLGVLLFNMLSRDLPFKSENHCQKELRILILNGKYSMEDKVWISISKYAKDLIRRMLVQNPIERIKVPDILDHPWIAKDLCIQATARKLMYANGDECIETKRPRLD